MSCRTYPLLRLASMLVCVSSGCGAEQARHPQPAEDAGPPRTSAPVSVTPTTRTANSDAGAPRPPTTSLPSGVSSAGGRAPSIAAAGSSGGGAGSGVNAAAVAGTAGTMTPSAAGAPAAAGSGGQSVPVTAERTLPQVMDVTMPGPFQVTVDRDGGASSWVFRPSELGKDGAKHPVFVMGNGAGGSPNFYMNDMSLLASHGIVVVHPTNSMVTAAIMVAALDWILEQNDASNSPYYQKLNGKAGMGGHSLGSLATFDAEAMETRLTTTIHVAGGSMDQRGSSKVKTPTAYICGETDFALPNCETDFETVEDQPTYFTVMAETDHIGAVAVAAPAMVAWLRWHLAGEVERRAEFIDPGGQFQKGIWVSKTKNW